MANEDIDKTTNALRKGLEVIYDQYGLEHQINKLAEECAEVIQAIARYKNAKCSSTYRAILEEFCDVCNVGDQLMVFKPQGFDGVLYRLQKVKRELVRINPPGTLNLGELLKKAKGIE